MGRLAGKVAIVTGAAQGQGAAIARAFVAEGAKVALADIADDLGKALADELGPDAIYVHHDVSDEDSWKAAVEQTVATFGPVTVLVNNAGVLMFADLPTMELSDFRRLIDINMVGCFLGMKTVAPVMVEAGGGSIVNCSSVEGLGGMPTLVAYTGTKFAVRGMTKAAAMELGPKNIRVNSVHPGMVDTAMTRGYARRPEAGRAARGHRPSLRLPGQRGELVLHRRRVRGRRRRHRHPRLRRLSGRGRALGAHH